MNKAVERVEGVMALFARCDINTDAIIPSTWLRTASADLGKGLFGGDRYDEQGNEVESFVLNRPAFRQSRLILADENFGCGSSREAAVWALVQFGIGCVLAPSFADIFYENAFKNNLVAGIINVETYQELKTLAEAHPEGLAFTVDLHSLTVSVSDANNPLHNRSWNFRMPASRVQAMIRGDDEITGTLHHQEDIADFYKMATSEKQWLFPEHLIGRDTDASNKKNRVF